MTSVTGRVGNDGPYRPGDLRPGAVACRDAASPTAAKTRNASLVDMLPSPVHIFD
jgi:hypothetical protein